MAEKRPDRTLGPGHDDFWAWCGKGELRLPRCRHCNTLAWPVVPVCENCGGEKFSWEPMSGRGKLVSWCSFERDYYAGMLPMPWPTILVELDEGVLFISNPAGIEDFRFSMPVRVSFIECEDKAGRFSLPVFG